MIHYRHISMVSPLFPAISVVTLPSPHHRWFVSNSSVAQVDPIMGLTKALELGLTTVVVEDTRVAGHIQVSSLNVVLPDTLRMYIAPVSTSADSLGVEAAVAIASVARWYVVSGRQYLIQLKVFSRGPVPQEIYLTEVAHASYHFPLSMLVCLPEFVHAYQGHKNITYCLKMLKNFFL